MPIVLVSFLASLTLPAISPDSTIRTAFLWLPAGIVLIAILTLIDICIILNKNNAALNIENMNLSTFDKSLQLPSVICARQSNEYPGDPVDLLLKSHPLFGQDIYVSIYTKESSGFEILIGLGTVISIVPEGKMQIRLLSWMEIRSSDLKKIIANDPDTLKNLKIRPSASREFLDIASISTMSRLLPRFINGEIENGR